MEEKKYSPRTSLLIILTLDALLWFVIIKIALAIL
jgi:hypothetical protein